MLGGRHVLPVLAAAMLPLGPALAQEADCATLRLLTASEADLSALSLQYRADGKMDLQVADKADLLAGANQCEIIGGDAFSLKCEWPSDAKADAQARFESFRAKIDQCLPSAEMKLEQNTYGTDTMKVLERYMGSAGGDEYGLGDADITMQLVEYKRFDGTIYYWVDLDFSR